ncbi:MAG: hypothetical protein WCF67_00250 [Chitinophagaceae bacterium]
MKRLNFLLACLVFTLSCLAQKSQIKWGEEFKLRKGSTDLEVIHSDNSGVYLQEGHLAIKGYFVVAATLRESATLVKLDKNLSEVFRNDFNKELKGKEFVQFFAFQDKMFLFASEYIKREKTMNIYGSEVNKNSGELMGDWSLVTSIQKEEKGDDINYKIILNADSSKIVVVSSIEGKEKNEYRIQEFEKSLRSTAKAVNISNEFDPKTFQLEDVLYTMNKKILLVGRRYEYQEGKKKKDKFLDFANYNIRLYDEQGKQQKEINTEINGKWLTSTKLVQEKDKDVVLVAFYNNSRKGKTIDGMLVQRIDPVSGNVISTSEKQINNSLISLDTEETASTNDDDDEKESKAERKEREKLDKMKNEGEAFSKYMQFRNIFYTEDNGVVILAEKYHHYTYTTSTYSGGSNGMPGTWRTTTYSVYECGDLLMCKIDATGNIGWLQVLPKAQREVISGGSSSGLIGPSFFDAGNRPFYAGFGAMQTKNSIRLLFNDHAKNAEVTQAGQKIKSINRFGRSNCFLISVDEKTGKCSRSVFYSNADIPTSMPRLGSVLGDNMFIIGKEDRVFGKSKIAVAKIVMN